MKTIIATGKYKVSFNTMVGNYGVGEERADTIDYAGDSVLELAKEVLIDSPDYKMVFEEVTNGTIVGLFYEANDPDPDWPVAIMYEGY